MAISAVLQQQTANRTLTNADLSSQNAVAATAADLAGGGTCAPQTPMASHNPLFPPDPPNFDLGDWPVTQPGGAWQVMTTNGGTVLVDGSTGPASAIARMSSGTPWSDYYVTASFVFPPGSHLNLGRSIELDARVQGTNLYYLLEVRASSQGPQFFFGPSTASLNSSSFQSINLGSLSSITLEIDAVGSAGGLSWAKIDGQVVKTLANPSISNGTIAVRSDSPVQIHGIVVNPIAAIPAEIEASVNTVGALYSCQRIDNIDGGAISQERAFVLGSCPARRVRGGAVTLTGLGRHDWKLWFAARTAIPLAVQFTTDTNLNSCVPAGASNTPDCTYQRSSQTANGFQLVAANCSSMNPTSVPQTYELLLPGLSGSLSPFTLRLAPVGDDSVFMTVAKLTGAGSSPAANPEESDIIMTGGSATLSYEGVLR
jgi:hypothetical protein